MVAQSPHRRQFRCACQIGIAFHHILHVRTVDKVIVHLSTLGPKTRHISSFVAKVKIGSEGVVKENTIGFVVVQTGVERDGLVNRVCVFSKGIGIRSPIFKTPAFEV